MKASSRNKIKSALGTTTLSYYLKGLVQRCKFGVREHPLLPPPERSGGRLGEKRPASEWKRPDQPGMGSGTRRARPWRPSCSRGRPTPGIVPFLAKD